MPYSTLVLFTLCASRTPARREERTEAASWDASHVQVDNPQILLLTSGLRYPYNVLGSVLGPGVVEGNGSARADPRLREIADWRLSGKTGKWKLEIRESLQPPWSGAFRQVSIFQFAISSFGFRGTKPSEATRLNAIIVNEIG